MPKTNDLATKKFVKEELNKTESRFEAKLDAKLEKAITGLKEWTEGKLDETFLRYRDEIMTKLDAIAGMLQKDDQERTVTSYRVSQHSDQLEDHEERIKKMEKSSPLIP